MYLLSLDFLSGDHAPCWRAFTPCNAVGHSTLQVNVQHFLDDPNLSGAMTDLLALMETVLTRPEGPRLFMGVKKRCHEAVAGSNRGRHEFICRLAGYGQAERLLLGGEASSAVCGRHA